MTRLERPALPPPSLLDEHVAVPIEFDWHEVCPVVLCDDGRPLAPLLDPVASVYRLRFVVPDRPCDHRVQYVGQTDNIRRRMQNYRSPSSGRQHSTNQKIRDAIVQTIDFQGSVTLDMVTDARGGAGEARLNLKRQVCRLLVEAAAVLSAAERDQAMLLNADEMKQFGERLGTRTNDEEGWLPARPSTYQHLLE